ncbi:MAG: hypothetical protein R3B68_15650 [Phycisphaerales bacterium]
MRGADLAALVALACRGVGEAIDAYDPFPAAGKVAGRLAAPAGLAIDRAVVRWLRQHARPDDARPRATPRLTGGTPIADWSLSVCGWQAWTEPDPRVRAGAAMMEGCVACVPAAAFRLGRRPAGDAGRTGAAVRSDADHGGDAGAEVGGGGGGKGAGVRPD